MPKRRRPRTKLWACLTLVLSFYTNEGNAQLDNETSPTHQFRSRPDLRAPIVDVTILHPELVTPGYIFLAPYRNLDPGPYIYDNLGNLVWSGAGQSGPQTAHTPRVCTYNGTDHLCFFQGEQYHGYARGHGVIMDRSYRVVKTIDSAGAGASSDMHEFKLTPYSNGTTVLMTVYQPRQYDLTVNPKFNLQGGLGWIVDGVFQEVDLESGKLIFEWRSLDHVDPSMAWTLPGTTDTSGDGLDEESSWDYFHLNSIDKNREGDYLISARHVSSIYKLSGQDGSIIWQLGGNTPSFEQTNFQFSYQHHARWISENHTHTVLSFYDNASNNYNDSAVFSHGFLVAIDHIMMTATMIKAWSAPEPEGGLLSSSQGNMQMLPNGGCHIGWGVYPYFSEHLSDGTAVQYAKVAERASNVMIYRSNKYNWTAQPLTKPALWTFSETGMDDMYFWVSWNGATEVARWSFYIGHTADGPWEHAGFASKIGFETEFYLAYFKGWSFAEAVDKDGRAMGRSVIAKTFVPGEKLRGLCGERGCARAERVPIEEAVSYDSEVEVAHADLSTQRGFNGKGYYAELPDRESDSSMDSSAAAYYTVAADSAASATNINTHAVGVGFMLGFLAAVLGPSLWRLSCRSMRRVRGSAWTGNLLGRYARVETGEIYDDAFNPGSSRTSGGV